MYVTDGRETIYIDAFVYKDSENRRRNVTLELIKGEMSVRIEYDLFGTTDMGKAIAGYDDRVDDTVWLVESVSEVVDRVYKWKNYSAKYGGYGAKNYDKLFGFRRVVDYEVV